jgi:putative phosphoesterase
MKVGILSDTHVPTIMKTLPSIIFDIFRDVDLILHAGDITELSVIGELEAIAPVEAVAGNMDNLEAQAKLPYKKVVTLGRYKAGLIHGKFKINVQQEMIRKEFGDVDLIVYGHSHTPFWGKVNGIYYLNPGSPTDKQYAPYNSVALLDIGEEIKAEIIRIEDV